MDNIMEGLIHQIATLFNTIHFKVMVYHLTLSTSIFCISQPSLPLLLPCTHLLPQNNATDISQMRLTAVALSKEENKFYFW